MGMSPVDVRWSCGDGRDRSRYLYAWWYSDVVAGYCFLQIDMLKTLSTRESLVGVITQEISDAVNQRLWNSLLEQGIKVLGLDLETSVSTRAFLSKER